MSSLTTTIPAGTWVLVTGANGFLASHIIIQFLERGFRVRGTVRNVEQSQWLLQGRFKTYADSHFLELVSVPDMGVEGAYDEAVKGVVAILHTAYVTRIVPDPNEVITPTVTGVRSIINSAKREPSVKEVVFTSTALTACSFDQKADNGTIGPNSWNDAVLEAAWAPPPYGLSHAMANYPASKVAAEKEVWKAVKENDLHFTVNVVSPAGIIGEPLTSKHVEGPASWVVHVFQGNKAAMDPLEASFYGNVKDLALLHVAAVLDPQVKNARLQSWGHSAHWNDFLAILRELRPQKTFVADYPVPYHIKVTVDQSDSVALLKKWGGQDGWTSLKDSIAENINTPYLDD
ncbi:putative aldehyde reductase 2 [Periconia macrospinosa]|uniref:Putative aldehyde reductase 2 n=1 Tax=Periconia macrospinosa TaxID=97972 RepID=A0A2V1E0C7_9PLEO|nr:putative aldehyde reductase 2 [Periconia macrospinosa]